MLLFSENIRVNNKHINNPLIGISTVGATWFATIVKICIPLVVVLILWSANRIAYQYFAVASPATEEVIIGRLPKGKVKMIFWQDLTPLAIVYAIIGPSIVRNYEGTCTKKRSTTDYFSIWRTENKRRV
jgi:hypothetical protein